MPSIHISDTSDGLTASRDRARGALLGLAVGDAVGTTVEFQPRDSYEPLSDLVGGGPFNLNPGEWTDDTAMALALGHSLLESGGLNEHDLMEKFCDWHHNGRFSCTGRCFDIGSTPLEALERFRRTGNPVAGSTRESSAGNGSLMRLAPVPIRYWNAPETRSDAARRQSLTTHGAPQAVDACIAFADLVAEAIAGSEASAILVRREGKWRKAVSEVMTMKCLSWRRNQVNASGYVIHCLEAALWAVGGASSFKDAVLRAANLWEDADTTAAVAGQLVGALYGAIAIPGTWLQKLAWRSEITQLADRLFDGANGQPAALPANRSGN
jgi:ADP-ribosyl-[dinitrogen reductase] hydrolase